MAFDLRAFGRYTPLHPALSIALGWDITTAAFLAHLVWLSSRNADPSAPFLVTVEEVARAIGEKKNAQLRARRVLDGLGIVKEVHEREGGRRGGRGLLLRVDHERLAEWWKAASTASRKPAAGKPKTSSCEEAQQAENQLLASRKPAASSWNPACSDPCTSLLRTSSNVSNKEQTQNADEGTNACGAEATPLTFAATSVQAQSPEQPSPNQPFTLVTSEPTRPPGPASETHEKTAREVRAKQRRVTVTKREPKAKAKTRAPEAIDEAVDGSAGETLAAPSPAVAPAATPPDTPPSLASATQDGDRSAGRGMVRIGGSEAAAPVLGSRRTSLAVNGKGKAKVYLVRHGDVPRESMLAWAKGKRNADTLDAAVFEDLMRTLSAIRCGAMGLETSSYDGADCALVRRYLSAGYAPSDIAMAIVGASRHEFWGPTHLTLKALLPRIDTLIKTAKAPASSTPTTSAGLASAKEAAVEEYIAVRAEYDAACPWEAAENPAIESPSYKTAAELRGAVDEMRAAIATKQGVRLAVVRGDT